MSFSDLIVNPATTANEMYAQCHETLTSLLDKHAPMQTRKVTSKPCIFTTNELLRAKRTKRQLERIWRHSKTALNGSKFRKQINLCNRLAEKNKVKSIHRENQESKWRL